MGGSAARLATVLAGGSPAGAIPHLALSSYPAVIEVTRWLKARTYKPEEGQGHDSWSDQPRRRATRRAAAKANERAVEIGSPREADWWEYWRCQGFVPSTRWPALVRKNGGARARLPAEAAGGNPGQYSGKSPEGVETRQEDPGMPKTVSITSAAGKRGRGLQTGG